jgi:hypothetical protein
MVRLTPFVLLDGIETRLAADRWIAPPFFRFPLRCQSFKSRVVGC